MRKKMRFFLLFLLANVIFIGCCNAFTFNCNYDGIGSSEGFFFYIKFSVENSKYAISQCYRLTDDRKSSKMTTIKERDINTSAGEFDCSNYSFESNNQDTNEPYCPESKALEIDQNLKKITWKKDTGTVSNKSTIDSYSLAPCPLTPSSSDDCSDNPYYSCVWVPGKNGNPGYCNINKLKYVMCGGTFDIPAEAPRIFSFAINLLKIGTPIILIIMGLITLVKAITASQEDEIKKAQSSLIKKVIAAVFVFLVTSVVQFVILKVAEDSEAGDISSCLSCFLNNDCDTNEYFKYEKSGKTYCHYVNNPTESFKCPDNVD